MFDSFKKRIPESVKARVKLFFVPTNRIHFSSNISDTKQNIYIFLCGFYQNLGDMALTFAQRYFLSNEFPDANIVLISSNNTYDACKYIKKYIRSNDIVTTLGGGNMDDMYVSLEEARLHVVRSFPNNRIISFPQTFAFSDTATGRKRQERSKRVYAKHKNLTIFVREPYSLERIKKAFPDVNIGYCPDIVLSLNKTEPRCERHGVLCCLRSDKEQNIQSGQRESLIQTINNEFHDVSIRDTVDVALEECKEERFAQTLEDFWNMLRHKEVVITDRLHCMIFCVITGTPCVVMDNSNHKISGVYQAWLKDKVPYIRYLDTQDTDTIILSARELLETGISGTHYDFQEEFAPLRRALHEQ